MNTYKIVKLIIGVTLFGFGAIQLAGFAGTWFMGDGEMFINDFLLPGIGMIILGTGLIFITAKERTRTEV